MKYSTIGLLILSLSLFGCDENGNILDHTTPPAAPTGLSSLALDRQVELWWDANPESDVEGYNIYASSSSGGRYTLIGSTSSPQYVDKFLSNGVAYYYSVSAYNRHGEEGELSRSEVYAIPRPEGFSLVLFDYLQYPNTAGFDFSSESLGKFDDQYTDVFFEFSNGMAYMDVWKDSDIQDMGYTYSLDDITVAPVEGWSPTKDVVLIKGHTYIVWTWDDHYAKFRVANIAPDHATIDWAYQTLTANVNLKHRPVPASGRNPLAAAKEVL